MNLVEFLNLETAIQNFEIDKTVLSPAKFDIEKLNFINQYYLKKISLDQFKIQLSESNILFIQDLKIELIYKEILSRCITLNDINLEVNKLINFFKKKEILKVNEEEITLIKKIYEVIQNLHDDHNIIKVLEGNDLFIKKIGKLMRKILVNFESKLPIDKIILFYGVGNLKERLLLYI